MELHIFFAVLLAAAMHAIWNAVVKGGGDPLLSITHMAFSAMAISGIALLFVDTPTAATWPWLILSVILHTGYRIALIAMYRLGDMGQVYPIARGTAPFMTALITFAIIGESLGIWGYSGIGLLGLGVGLISLKGSRLGGIDTKAAGAALITSCWISGYTFADGYGARLNGNGGGPSYAIWLFFLSSATNIAWGYSQRGGEIFSTWRHTWKTSTGATCMSELAYFIAIWAMTKAPIALVAALRETSVLFAAGISVVILREPLTVWRIAAAIVIVAGAMLLRLG